MTADPIAGPDADPDRTAVLPPVEAPLPPYAQSRTYPSVPMSPSAPTPPPAYPPAASTPAAPAASATPAAAPATASAPPPSVADAMVEISMPPLAATALEAPTSTSVLVADAPPAGTGRTDVVPASEAGVATELAPAEPASPTPTVAAAMPPALAETVTCPECGTIAHVTLNRRESVDFCRTCDYPLFWTPSKVVRDTSDTGQESLRRLPGQAGRATIAALPCPFCYEPNALSAQTCIRCGRPMHPVEEPPPPPAPIYVAPEPVVVEPVKKVAWWVWALLALGAAALIVLIVLIGTGTIG